MDTTKTVRAISALHTYFVLFAHTTLMIEIFVYIEMNTRHKFSYLLHIYGNAKYRCKYNYEMSVTLFVRGGKISKNNTTASTTRTASNEDSN